jgi:hypothetical protein
LQWLNDLSTWLSHQTLAKLTEWNIGEIRRAMNLAARPEGEEKNWYQRLLINKARSGKGEARQRPRLFIQPSTPHILTKLPLDGE